MATLYVWKAHGGDVGHVSLEVGDTYISYWPNEAAGKNDVKLGASHEAMFPRGYAFDRRLERRSSDEQVQMTKLDADRVQKAWVAFRNNPRRYNMVEHNCSTVVASLLKIGSGKEPSFVPGVLIDDYARDWAQRMFLRVRFFSKRITMWTPDDVLRYALEIES